MAEENKKSDTETSMSDLAADLKVSPSVNASDLMPNTNNIPANISSVERELLMPTEEIGGVSSKTVDQVIINNNTKHHDIESELRVSAAAIGGQPISQTPNDFRSRSPELSTTIPAGFPNEMDTEKLPPNMSGATPPPSRGLSSLRSTSADIKSGGNRYGFS